METPHAKFGAAYMMSLTRDPDYIHSLAICDSYWNFGLKLYYDPRAVLCNSSALQTYLRIIMIMYGLLQCSFQPVYDKALKSP